MKSLLLEPKMSINAIKKMNLLQWQKDLLVVGLAIGLGVGGHFLVGELSLVQIAEALEWNTYLVGFIITFIGNASILLPVAYAAAIPVLALLDVHPLLFGFICGFGAGIGEMSAYLLGKLSRRSMEEESREKLERMKEKFGHSNAFLIFLGGLLPIPDEFVIVPLSSAGYPLSKLFPLCTFGKILLCVFLSYLGLVWEGVFTYIRASGDGMPLRFSILTPIFIIAFYLFLRIDWMEE